MLNVLITKNNKEKGKKILEVMGMFMVQVVQKVFTDVYLVPNISSGIH
jgi:hypothetical protein